jgi:hypothetical protein
MLFFRKTDAAASFSGNARERRTSNKPINATCEDARALWVTLERMKGDLTIKGDLEHDGDGLFRLYFAAKNENFSGATAAWAADTQVAEFASVLAGFPSKIPSEVTYSFGSPKSGQCHLRFVTIDNVGHCAAWVQVISEDAAYARDEFESSLVCLKVTAAALDRFCLQLNDFKRGRDNAAMLSEDAL